MNIDIEAERKLFDQWVPAWSPHAMEYWHAWQARAALAAAHHIPELHNLGKVTRTGDQSIRLEFTSCRSANVFEKFIRSASPSADLVKSDELIKMLERIVQAWESTLAGETTVREIQRWIVEDMKPAIDEVRTLLAKVKS